MVAEGDTVVVEARYHATAKATGEPLDAQVVHVWDFKGDKLVRWQQYVDTWARGLRPRRRQSRVPHPRPARWRSRGRARLGPGPVTTSRLPGTEPSEQLVDVTGLAAGPGG